MPKKIYLTENELIDLIEKIVTEVKANEKKTVAETKKPVARKPLRK